jgi:phytol kinase
MKRALLFVLLWLTIGFSIGTATLLGPVRWVTVFCRGHALPDGIEKWAVRLVIVLLVAVTALAAWILARAAAASARAETRYGLPLLAIAAAAGAVWLWMTPAMLRAQAGGETADGAHFTFGPYPDEDRMRDLRGEGYTAIVTLLHPAVIPFEPELLKTEEQAAARAGIELIHLPMLPWVSDNTESLDRVRALARARRGRYYVHCYLGMDRVQVVRRIVDQESAGVDTGSVTAAMPIGSVDLWGRGAVLHLDGRVHVTPFPSDEEFLRFLVAGNTRLVSLLDDKDPDDRDWIAKERGIVERYRIPYTSLPLSTQHYDPRAVLKAAQVVRGLPGTMVVHDFLPPASGKSAAAEAFAQAYRSGRPPLPASLFADPLAAGAARVIAPHVAIGPRPAPAEFGAVLARRGVRAVVFLGEARSRAAREDRVAAAEGHVEWIVMSATDTDAVVARLERGGPYYLYGTVGDTLSRAIADRFGPPLPPRVTEEAERLFAALPAPAPPSAPAATPPPGRGTTRAAAAVESTSPPVTSLAGIDPPATPPATPPVSGGGPAAGARAFVARAIPDFQMVVLLSPFLLLFAGAAAGLSSWMRTTRGFPVAYSRKGFHFLIFTMAGALQIFGGLPAVMLFGGLVSLVVLYAVARGDGFPFYEALARPADAPRRTLFILVPLATTALGGLAANLLFGAHAIVGYLVGGWGDAVGEPVGRAFGRHTYRVPSFGGVAATRSLEGSAAVLVAGTAAATLVLLARGVPPSAAAGVGLACGIAGAAVEAFSTHGADNLTVQVAAAGAAFFLLS